MNNNAAAEQAARSVLKKYGLYAPSLDELTFIIQSYGYEIIDYDKDSYSSDFELLIEELSLQNFAAQGKAFLYQKKDIRLLFVSSLMTPDEKRYVFAHELGHIVCGHMKGSILVDSDVQEEAEANEFAHYLLHPKRMAKMNNWILLHKKQLIITGAIIAIICVSIPTIYYFTTRIPYNEEYYVTENGAKYHLINCITIKNSGKIHHMTQAEFLSGDYDPCQVCLPNAQKSRGIGNG